MKEENVKQLKENYPWLKFRTDIGVGDGWFNILNSLFLLMCSDCKSAQRGIDWCKSQPLDDSEVEKESRALALQKYERDLFVASSKLPSIDCIKEKFGGLRVYFSETSDENLNYSSFAMLMSECTCEVCGNPGYEDDDGLGWTKTLCAGHHAARKDNRGLRGIGEDTWLKDDDKDVPRLPDAPVDRSSI